MKYYNLNIKIEEPASGGSTAAKTWLEERKAAPIFFGEYTPDQLKSGGSPYGTKALNEAICFMNLEPNQADVNLVTIDSGCIWIYRISGQLRYGEEFQFYDSSGIRVVPKYFPIEVIAKLFIHEAPYILAAMKSSQAFARGTFTEINKDGSKYIGNVAAINCVLGRTHGLAVNPLKCLSSVELETLVAKILEEHGAHVPAHRGAVLKDVDLFAEIESASPMLKSDFPNEKIISVQVKIDISSTTDVKPLGKFLEKPGHMLVTTETVPNEELMQICGPQRYKTTEWVQAQVNCLPKIRIWLERSLQWLPKQAWRELL